MATNPKITKAERRVIEFAKAVNLPLDSLLRFQSAGYVPQPKQFQFHAAARFADSFDNPNLVGFGGARGGGKTHTTFAQVAIDDCQRVANLKVLFLRKVSKSAREAVTDLRLNILMFVPHRFDKQSSTIHFPNGSRIIVGHFNYEKDIDNYLGLEYDIIIIEEATQLSYTKVKQIRTCNRSSKPNFRPRMYFTSNPGGVGHNWFKELFIKPYRTSKETETKFIPSTVRDNSYVNPEYIHTLEALSGWQKKAWLDGDWDILAGQFFSNFQYDTHVIKPFEIPSHWEKWSALDYGFNHPTVSLLFTKNDGIIYVTAEYGERKRLVGSNAEGIKQTLKTRNVQVKNLSQFVAGQDAFAQRGNESGKTIADQYKDYGIELTPANTDRISGAGQILNLLGDTESKIEPKLFIFDTCVNLIEQLPVMQHDPNRPEDVLKVDIDDDGFGGDDYYDTLRYGVMVGNVFEGLPERESVTYSRGILG